VPFQIDWVGRHPVKTADANLDLKSVAETEPTFLDCAEV